jgi:predicted deacylase
MSASSASALSVHGVRAEPGSTVYGGVPAVELADGTVVEIPIVLTAGARPGPTVFVGAGVHGDEITGVEAVHRAIRALDPSELRGNVISVPIQNPLAVQMQYRTALQLTAKSSLDQAPGDPSLCFPGDPNGNTVQRMAATIFAMMERSDAVIDLHTPATGGRYLPFIFLPARSTGPAAERAMELARAFQPRFILDTDHGPYITAQMAHMVLAGRGIPAFGMETGEGGRLEEDLAADVARGVLNVLGRLDMVDREIEDRDVLVLRAFTPVRCSRGGILHTAVELGDHVEEGALLATITDRYGHVVEEVFAPHAGMLNRATTFATVASGERVAQLGLEA